MTSFAGQQEVTTSTSPNVCDLLGHANEADLIVGGRTCRGLIDTGSMITSVGEQFYKDHLQNKYPLQEVNDLLKVEGAGGHQLVYVGYAEVELSVPDHSNTPLWVPVLVAPATSYNQRVPFIIGTNVIKHLHPCKSEDIWTSAINAVSAQESIPEEVPVYCCKEMVIPPNSSVGFGGRIGPSKGVTAGVLEPVTSLPGGVMLVQGAVCPDSINQVPVVLKNVSDRTISIPARQQVASLHTGAILEPNCHQTQENPAEITEIPVHLDEPSLTSEQKNKVQKTLLKWKDVFAFSPMELGTAKGVKHRIKLTDDVPFKERPRRIPPGMYEEVKCHLRDMLACGAIRPSSSPYSSGVVLVRKKDNSLRLCLDFRRLNSKTIRDAYFLPKIEDTLDNLQGAKWFSSLDLQSGYWQVEMEEEDKAKTGFSVGNLGFYEANRMPFGLTNAPATFQRLMEKTLKDLPNCFAYLDDIIIYSSGTVEDHLSKLESVFSRLLEYGLKLKPSKCHLLLKKVKYLGHVVSENGVEADPDKVEAVAKWPLPETVQELRQALGFFGYYRRFVKDFSKLAKPLHDLLKGVENKSRINKKTPIVMNPEAIAAFYSLKEKLTSPPILAFADYKLPFQVSTDASTQGLGAILYQVQDGKSRVIAYASRGLKPSELNYPAHKLEFLALKWAVCDKFHDYLYGHSFDVYTDNNPLSYILTSAKLDATGHRWLAELSLYNFKVHYKPGRNHTDADHMSRLPGVCTEVERTIDEEAVKAISNGIHLQQAIVEQLCADRCALQYYEQEVYPVDVEMDQSAPVWRETQMNDDVLQQLIPMVESGQRPEWTTLSSDLRPYIREWDKLVMLDGVLYRSRLDPDTDCKVHQLVLPSSERQRALTGLHDDVGHLGRDRTLQLVRARFFWPRMAEDVKEKVRTCPVCIKRKTTHVHRAPLVNITTTQPMELVSIDYLTLEPSKGGIENILVITDHFTRLAHAIPTRNQTAKTTAQALYNFFLIYGFPLQLLADQGRNFESRTIKELCKLAGIQKSRTTPYHAMGNGMTERMNQTLLDMLGCLTEDQKADWKKYLPSVVHAYNATRHDSTGYSPFFLMFGRHPRLAIDVAMGLEPKDDLTVDFTKNLQDRLDLAYKLAVAQAEKSSSRYKSQYDKRVRGSSVCVGDRVLVKNVTIRGKNKLANVWEDPVYQVVEQPNKDIPVFVVKREDGKGNKRTLHRNLLLPVNFLPVASDVKSDTRSHVRKPREPVMRSETAEDESSEGDDSDEEEEDRYPLRSRWTPDPTAEEFVPRAQREQQDMDVMVIYYVEVEIDEVQPAATT